MTPVSRLDSGNRTFLLQLAIVVGFRVTVMVSACCVVCVVGVRLASDGVTVLWAGGGWMLPAALLAALVVASTVTVVVRAAHALWADATLRRRLRARAVDPGCCVHRLAAAHSPAEYGLWTTPPRSRSPTDTWHPGSW